MHRRTADAQRPGRCGARQGRAHHDPAADVATVRAGGPGRARLHRAGTEPAVGRRHHLRGDLVRVRLRRLRHRPVLPAHRRAGAPRPACAPTWPWTPWSMAVWQRQRRDQRRAPVDRGWSTTPTAACSTSRSATPNGSPRPARSPRSARAGDSYDNAAAESLNRPVQDRADPPPRTLARPGRRRARHLGMGRLVQPPPAAQRLRRRSTRRVRGTALPSDHRSESPRRGRTEPPLNPGRFTRCPRGLRSAAPWSDSVWSTLAAGVRSSGLPAVGAGPVDGAVADGRDGPGAAGRRRRGEGGHRHR